MLRQASLQALRHLRPKGGHGWPGTPARRGDSKPIAAFQGAAKVWEFLSKHRRDPAATPASK